MDNAESASMSHMRKGNACDPHIEYYDSKEMLEPNDTIPPTETAKLDDRSMPPIIVPIRRVILQENRHFFNNRVNTSMSSVHLPTSVFARGSLIRPFTHFSAVKLMRIVFSLFADCSVLEDIQWSNQLDSIFLDNYRKDPTLSWQFFGSARGFMRHFPGKIKKKHQFIAELLRKF